MNKSESITELAKALHKAQGKIKHAVKDSANPFFKSKYADLTSVWDAIRDAFQAEGLSVAQIPSMAESGAPCLETLLMHTSGQWLSGVLPLNPIKSDPQGIGSAITYMRRYALQSIAGVCADDDDGEAANGRGGNKKQDSRGVEATKKPSYTDDQKVEAGRLRSDAKEFTNGEARFSALWKKMAYDSPVDFIDAASQLLRDLQEENQPEGTK